MAAAGQLQTPAAVPVAHVEPGDAAVILYTSGTTADPKGVVLTHGNLEAERAAVLSVVQANERDVVLGVLPLFHALAQMANLWLPLTIGAKRRLPRDGQLDDAARRPGDARGHDLRVRAAVLLPDPSAGRW